jgi:hypothetical protein
MLSGADSGAVGNAGCGYPLPWSEQTWLPMVVATPNGLAHSDMFACNPGDLIHSLRVALPCDASYISAQRG